MDYVQKFRGKFATSIDVRNLILYMYIGVLLVHGRHGVHHQVYLWFKTGRQERRHNRGVLSCCKSFSAPKHPTWTRCTCINSQCKPFIWLCTMPILICLYFSVMWWNLCWSNFKTLISYRFNSPRSVQTHAHGYWNSDFPNYYVLFQLTNSMEINLNQPVICTAPPGATIPLKKRDCCKAQVITLSKRKWLLLPAIQKSKWNILVKFGSKRRRTIFIKTHCKIDGDVDQLFSSTNYLTSNQCSAGNIG